YIPSSGQYQAFWNGNGSSAPIVDGTSPACSNPNNGWRLPSQSEWGELYKGGMFSGVPGAATANSWTWASAGTGTPGTGVTSSNRQRYYNRAGGYQIRPDNATTTLFLPASGYRRSNNGWLYHQGTNGYYWSSAVTGISAYNLSFSSGSVGPANSNDRAYGFALRCIKNL
ncbi:MAG: fibrobacter succinogenes major paralogous domain-containing protein, partial [Tannerella sp.]|nr:fibrobacter succinogenes major paralogous domain-containing protein [Tannerella sp.]